MITNSILTQTASLLRKAETDAKSMSADEIREALANIYVIKKEFESIQPVLEAQALKRKLSDTLFVEKEVKFQIKSGNDKTEYHVEKISKLIPLAKFAKIVNIVDGRAKTELTEDEYKVVLANKVVTPSEKMIVSISKMTQKEILAEKQK